eukprot:CFRG3106T1
MNHSPSDGERADDKQNIGQCSSAVGWNTGKDSIHRAPNYTGVFSLSNNRQNDPFHVPSASPGAGKKSLLGNFHKVQRLSLLVGVIGYLIGFAIYGCMLYYEVQAYDSVAPEHLVDKLSDELEISLTESVNLTCVDIVYDYSVTLSNLLIEEETNSTSGLDTKEYLWQQMGRLPYLLDESVVNALDEIANNFIVYEFNQTLLQEDLKVALGNASSFCEVVGGAIASATDREVDVIAEQEEIETLLGTALIDSIGGSVETVFLIAMQVYYETAKAQGLDRIFIVCASFFAVTDLFFIVICIFLYKYRNEHEVRSRHRYFLAHFNIGAMVIPIINLLGVAVTTAQFSTNQSTNQSLYTAYACVITFVTVLGPVSSVFLRQRFMYQVFWKGAPTTWFWEYFVMMPWYFFLALLVVVNLIVGHIINGDLEWNLFITYIPVYVVGLLMWTEFSYYAWHVREASFVFVDVWQAYRFLIAWGVTFLIFHFSVAYRHSIALSSLSATSHLMASLLGAYIDFFFLPLLKVLCRSHGYHILDEYDFGGSCLGIDFNHIELVLNDPEACNLLLEFSKLRYCSEAVEFLIEWKELEELYRLQPKAYQECWERVLHIANALIFPHVLNVSCTNHKVLVDKLVQLISKLDTATGRSRSGSLTSSPTAPTSASPSRNRGSPLALTPLTRNLKRVQNLTHAHDAHETSLSLYDEATKAVDWGEVISWFEPVRTEIIELLFNGQLKEFCTQAQMRGLIQRRMQQNHLLVQHKLVSRGTNTTNKCSDDKDAVEKSPDVEHVCDIPRMDSDSREATASVARVLSVRLQHSPSRTSFGSMFGVGKVASSSRASLSRATTTTSVSKTSLSKTPTPTSLDHTIGNLTVVDCPLGDSRSVSSYLSSSDYAEGSNISGVPVAGAGMVSLRFELDRISSVNSSFDAGRRTSPTPRLFAFSEFEDIPTVGAHTSVDSSQQ